MGKTFEWTGRMDPEDGPLAKRWHQMAHQSGQGSGGAIGLLGFGCDLGVARNKGRTGAAEAPDAIRKALASLAWHGPEVGFTDYGTVAVEGDSAGGEDALVTAQERFGDAVAKGLSERGRMLVLGGGHETAAGSFNGLLKYLEGQAAQRIGILNLDAHFDLRKPGQAGASSGTPFYQIHEALAARGQAMHYLCLGVAETANTQALFERAKDWGVDFLLDRQVQSHAMGPAFAAIDRLLAQVDQLYLTIDLDVLPHWQMPGVSAPAAYGVSLEAIEAIILYLGSKDTPWPLSDLVEYNPSFDPDGRAAKVVARLCDTVLREMLKQGYR